MNIGETIRNYRLQKGMSQGDIEKRTGLLRCYLSRVENGHTIPSLDTLAKIATAMELPLAQFFHEGNGDNGGKAVPQLAEEEVRFLTQIRRYSASLNDSDRKLVIAMVKKMASSVAPSVIRRICTRINQSRPWHGILHRLHPAESIQICIPEICLSHLC